LFILFARTGWSFTFVFSFYAYQGLVAGFALTALRNYHTELRWKPRSGRRRASTTLRRSKAICSPRAFPRFRVAARRREASAHRRPRVMRQ
jgi:hypothetical protein